MLEEYREFSEIQAPVGELSDAQAGELTEFQEYDEGTRNSQETIRFSEGGYTSDGRFVAGQVCEVNSEAAEFDPEIAELADELNSWIEQGEQMSCAVASQTMAVNQLENGYHSESELLDIGREEGWYDEGTCPEDVGKIAEHMGMDVEQSSHVKAGELTMANDAEVKVLANVDSTLLHYPECFKRCQADHVVQVLRVESTPQGEVVIINDPGHPGGRGAVYPIEIFERAFTGDITSIRKGEDA